MPKEDIVKYIEEAKYRGVADNAIRTTLLYAHWTEAEIDEAFKTFRETRKPFDSQISSGGGMRTVNFSSQGVPAAESLEKKSRAGLIVILFMIIAAAIFAVWYISKENNIFEPVQAIPIPEIE